MKIKQKRLLLWKGKHVINENRELDQQLLVPVESEQMGHI